MTVGTEHDYFCPFSNDEYMHGFHSICIVESSARRFFFAVFGAAWLTWWCLETHGTAVGILAMIATGGLGIFLWSLKIVLRQRSISNGITGSAVRASFYGLVQSAP